LPPEAQVRLSLSHSVCKTGGRDDITTQFRRTRPVPAALQADWVSAAQTDPGTRYLIARGTSHL